MADRQDTTAELRREPADLIQQLRGRAAFCRARGEVKTPGLLEEAAARLATVEALRKEQTSSPNPYDDCAHFDDHAVNRFAVAMKGKLAAKRLQGRGGWQEPDVENGYLSRLLREHVDKGDPVDVANLAMMIHQRGERIGPENEGATCGAIERADAELAVAEAIRRAADLIVSSAYTSNGDRRSLEPVAESLRGADQHHATIAAAILALAPGDALTEVQRLQARVTSLSEQVDTIAEQRDAAMAQLDRHLSIFADHAAVVWGIIRAAGDLPGLADGPYKDGFIAGMEEVAARGDIQAADGHHQLQNLCEQIVALVTGQATLVMAPAAEVASKMAAAADRDAALARAEKAELERDEWKRLAERTSKEALEAEAKIAGLRAERDAALGEDARHA